MPKRDKPGALEITRPIRTKRDFQGVAAVVRRISRQPDRDSAAERRLQALLKELDKFEAPEDDAGEDSPDYDDPGLRRRWSDGGDGE